MHSVLLGKPYSCRHFIELIALLVAADPFIEAINPAGGDNDNIPGNIEVVYDDGFRHKHIRVKGLPTEALCIMNDWMKEHNR